LKTAKSLTKKICKKFLNFPFILWINDPVLAKILWNSGQFLEQDAFTSLRRRKYVVLQEHLLTFNENKIFAISQQHKEYSIRSTTLRDLAKFDNYASYNVGEDTYKKLVH
jgi:hypothetical protein